MSYFGTDLGDLTADEMHGRTPDPVPRPSETPLTEDELSVKVTRAYAEIHALCHGKRWLMSIPVRPEADSDTIICDALRALKDRVKILEAELARRSPSVPTATQEQRDAGVVDATYWRDKAKHMAALMAMAGATLCEPVSTANIRDAKKSCDLGVHVMREIIEDEKRAAARVQGENA